MEELSLMEKVTGVVENVVYRNENNDYTVFGKDEETRNDYVATYQKVLRMLEK